jgi:nucleoside-diphosphate-sugar epimerase
VLRPPVVLGPHAVGAKEVLPGPLAPLGLALWRLGGRIRAPLPVPDLPLQFIHEDDVGQALLLSIVGAGPPGAYNIAGDGIVTAADAARELGLTPVTVPGRLVRAAARVAGAAPLPATVEWMEAAGHPSIVDATKAKRELGWTPRYTSLEALRATL